MGQDLRMRLHDWMPLPVINRIQCNDWHDNNGKGKSISAMIIFRNIQYNQSVAYGTLSTLSVGQEKVDVL
jgi:hypothetical protein